MAARSNTPRVGERSLMEAAREAGVEYATARWRLKNGWPLERVLGPVETPTRDAFDEAWVPEPNSGCWIWLRGQNGMGYGTFKTTKGRKDRRSVLAHRFSYERAHGPIPAGLDVLHRCDNPICVNPDHLFAGTAADNLQDMARKGRNNGQKLSPADVLAIRKDPRNLKAVAADYGVSFHLISKIRHRKAWSHLGDTP